MKMMYFWSSYDALKHALSHGGSMKMMNNGRWKVMWD